MAKIEQVVEINVPLRTVYQRLLQFEEYPRFMQGVRSVRRLDDTHLHWRAEINGKETEWNAEITEQVAEHSIAWRNTSGPKSEGKVSFETIAPDKTLVMLEMDAEISALRHRDVADSKTPRDEHDLARFKKMLESEQQSSAAGSEAGDIGNIRADIGSDQAENSAGDEVAPQAQSSPGGGASVVEAQPDATQIGSMEQTPAAGTPAAQPANQPDQAAKQEANQAANQEASTRQTASALRAGRRSIDRSLPPAGAVSSYPSSYLPFMPSLLQAWEEPFALMRRMGEEMEQFFGRWSGRTFSAVPAWPPVDITQQGDQWIVCADLPGIRKEDVQVEISGAQLTITGERRPDQAQQSQTPQPFSRSERRHGHFYRAVDLPGGVDADAVRASMHDGVLEITLPLQAQQARGGGHRVDVRP